MSRTHLGGGEKPREGRKTLSRMADKHLKREEKLDV